MHLPIRDELGGVRILCTSCKRIFSITLITWFLMRSFVFLSSVWAKAWHWIFSLFSSVGSSHYWTVLSTHLLQFNVVVDYQIVVQYVYNIYFYVQYLIKICFTSSATYWIKKCRVTWWTYGTWFGFIFLLMLIRYSL